MSQDLLNANKDTPEFSLYGLTLQGKVVELYDADTCKIVLPVENKLYKFTCRLNGIDTPEMKPRKDKPNRDKEIEWAKKARNELLRLVNPSSKCCLLDNPEKKEIIKELEENKNTITVKCLEFDKYGRLLVELFSNSNSTDSFNKILVDKNLAVFYDGGKKINPWSQ